MQDLSLPPVAAGVAPGNIAAHAIHVADVPNGAEIGSGPRPRDRIIIAAVEKRGEGTKGCGCAPAWLDSITPR